MDSKRNNKAGVSLMSKLSLLFLCLQLTFISCQAQKGIADVKAEASNPVLKAKSMDESSEHPNLTITKSGVALIKSNIDQAPLFKTTLKETIKEVDAEIELGVKVPVPKDMAGGYTHERHKKNFFILQKTGNLYQITGDEKYAEYIKEVFMAYAEMFPTLPLHPTNRSYATGKIFWQCLNDANWLVYSSQAYDCIYDYLSKEERDHLESKLFRPFADFISIENPQFFNRVHNHSTWANAAVGMMGLAMHDEELIERALFGIQNDGIDPTMVDNDGGYIKVDGQKKAGFFAQLDYSFSPDGHFTEGPYYLRYAMSPFLLFAKCLHNSRPELNIYDYRDGILEKAIYSLLNETDANGLFFPINDAQKGMSWLSREVVGAIDIGYHDFGLDPMLLSIAEKQGKVLLDENGFVVARDLHKGMATPFAHQSIAYTDGADGKNGGIGILRADGDDEDEVCLLMKYAAHGMGHGHFDRLGYSLYDETGEVIQDYGSARWVNIDQKGGGRYLPENNTYAKQTIAHNTVTANEISQYEGSVKKGDANASTQYFFDASNVNLQAVSAKDDKAYPGVEMHRTMLLLKDDDFRKPLLIDIFKLTSEQENQYDLPVWFLGHLLSASFEYDKEAESLTTLGSDHGYQHIWREATGHSDKESAQITWFGNRKFYTLTSATDTTDELIFVKTGANDPDFNLRYDPALIHRKKGAKDALFVSAIESHGLYNPVSEISSDPFSGLEKIEVLHDSVDYTAIKLTGKSQKSWMIVVSNEDNDPMSKHQLKINSQTIEWTGPIQMNKANSQ